MIKVFYADQNILEEQSLKNLFKKSGYANGIPFLLNEDEPVREANSWLKSLPSRGASSPLTWQAYAQDISEWIDFLDLRGQAPLEATKEDISAFHAKRRLGENEQPLSPASWNRKVAAIDNFYQWALDEDLIENLPFSYRYARLGSSDGRQVGIKKNLAKEKEGRASAKLKWLEEDQLRFFMEVGISGLLPDGSEDPEFRGRNVSRNRAFAELLASTGLRSQEASHLLYTELPGLPEKPLKFIRFELPGVVCKGGSSRKILIPPKTIRLINSFVDQDRSCWANSWKPDYPLQVTDLSHEKLKLDGKQTKLSNLSISQRLRLMENDRSPLLFLGRAGKPMTDWEEVFGAASIRCQKFQVGFPSVQPHMLRHTFAVNMLRWLIEQVASAVQKKVKETDDGAWAGYWQAHDPLITLRDLLGHSSVQTTQVYLHAIDATRLYANIIDELEEMEDGDE
jgi:site-specific recombinase XerD